LRDEDRKYFNLILNQLEKAYSIAIKAKKKRIDPEDFPEILLAWDMAERVEKLVGPRGIANFIRINQQLSREELALKAVDAILNGEFGVLSIEKAADQAIRTALAILTEGVTVAPTQGIYKVCIRKNPYPYLSIYFAGPIRSAGGTEAGLILVYADYVRKRLGLMRYRPLISETENEINRFVEEIRTYEREVGRFQFHVPDSLIELAVSRLPIEINGVPTTNVEVTLNRNMTRIETNRLRGGALIVLNDGLIARAKKILGIISELKIEGWEWLSEINVKDLTHKGENTIFGVIGGRPVISFPEDLHGFRLRYGRAPNMGLSAVGVHPATFAILDYIIVPGTQIKVEYPGKGAIVVPVSSISPPIVKLKDLSVIRVRSEEEAERIKADILQVLWLGDMLISVGDFLENNALLRPSPYVEEWWLQDFKEALLNNSKDLERLNISTKRQMAIADGETPTFEEALLISQVLKIPLHPSYTLRWRAISVKELKYLLEYLWRKATLLDDSVSVPYDSFFSLILDKLLVTYIVKENEIRFKDQNIDIFRYLFKLKNRQKLSIEGNNILKVVSSIFRAEIRDTMGSIVPARMGRPEKASHREMSPSVHVLFPVGIAGGPTRNLVAAAEDKGVVSVNLAYRRCKKCGAITYYSFCRKCGVKTEQLFYCKSCNAQFKEDVCPSCGRKLNPFRETKVDLKTLLLAYKTKLKPFPKLIKGVKALTSGEKIPEYIEKGLLRAFYNLSVFKDGTIRFDATNAPLTHFRPVDIGLSLEKAHQLGYNVRSIDQTVPLKVQDIIIPRKAAEYLVRISLFVDKLLEEVYGLEPYYNVKRIEDLVGKLVVGLSPHTSVGVIGRIIGFTDAQVLYAHPFWHATKRRDCDGDQDSIMLLMDVLLNFSRHYLPKTIGGEMDTPLLLSPVVIPAEVDSQAHKIELVDRYPREFYDLTLEGKTSNEAAKLFKWVYNILNTNLQYSEIPFQFNGCKLSLKNNITTYSRLKTMYDKILHQIKICELISPDFTSKIAKSIIEHHLLPDLIGNLKAYINRGYRCKKCGAIYRRPPLFGKCERCGGGLIPTVKEKNVIKYLLTIKQLLNKYCAGESYLNQRFYLLERELKEIISVKKDQRKLIDYF